MTDKRVKDELAPARLVSHMRRNGSFLLECIRCEDRPSKEKSEIHIELSLAAPLREQ